MKVNDFIIGVGPNAEVAQRILYNAIQMKWQNGELGMYYNIVLHHLSAGADVEKAITEANHILILTNVQE